MQAGDTFSAQHKSAPFPESKIEIAIATASNQIGFKFKKGEKILLDRSVKAQHGFVFGRIGTRQGMVS